ncbi:MAG TPA: amidohydrolase [Thermoanaerobaculia bacterium]|jgi:predicted amidohydrolase YtcJ|nr:amidohydrolase [Thermoanaerobaculia bacterium]
MEGNRIAAVDAPIPQDARVIDLHGRLALPGFIDNHVHFINGGFQLSRVQLRDATSADEFVRRIAVHALQLDVDQWLTGGGWDEQRWSPPAMPSRQMIDAATPGNPALLTRLDMHMALASSRALQLANITRETPDPPGGTIVRDADGEATGLLKDTAMTLVSAVIPRPSLEERIVAARAALQEAARFGVTSFCDMGMSPEAFEDFRAYQRLEREGALTARVSLFMPIGSYERLQNAGVEKHFGSERLRVGGLKGFADGSLGSSTAAFREPFTDEPHHCGLVMAEMSDGSMAKWVEDADAHELQIAIHAIGDRANADVLSIFESRPDIGERRFRIEHAQHLDPSLIERFARSGVIASMQPYHAIDDGRWAETKIGSERAKATYAFRSLIDAGATVTFGSDWTVAPLNPLLGIYAAVTRRTIDGRNPKGWIPEQKITVEEALRCYTVNNAYAMFAEREVGRIAPGMLADVVVLSEDLFAIAPEEIENVNVDMTILGGDVIYERI